MPMVVHIVKWQILFAYNAKQAQENPVPVLLANIVVGGYRHTAFSGGTVEGKTIFSISR